MPLGIKQRHFIDESGRVIILRGVNLAGISISYQPNGATHIKDKWPPEDFLNTSWIGRPFPLEESDEHFKRLRAWGFNCVRMLSSWEAVEHAGPYEFDDEYIEYFTEIVRKAGEYKLNVFINFHQDVWSRATGGDGHPLWLYNKVGLDYSKFDEADAAINMQNLWDPDPKKNRYGKMVWGENSKLFPPSTMWTLFWAGSDFTPKFLIEDEASGESVTIEEYMQLHFTASTEKIAEPLANMKHVFGFNPINEPSMGYIGKSVGKRVLKLEIKEDGQYNEPLPGIAWSPLDTMAAAAGYSRDIEELGFSLFKGFSPKRTITVNPNKIRVWNKDAEDFWETHGVWGIINEEPVALKENYFQKVKDRIVDFTSDYLVPFHKRIAKAVRKYNKNWLLLIENDPSLNGSVRYKGWPKEMPENSVNAFHWYDLIQLALKRFFWPLTLDIVKIRPVWGMKGIQRMYARQMKPQIELSKEVNDGNFPLLVGEFGIAMDMKGGKAFKNWNKKREKAFKKHAKIINLMYNALDELLLSGTHWNYASFNRNEFGDMWNQEDLSIYSKDQEIEPFSENIYSGARGIGGFCRPYARKIAGIPSLMKFDWKSGVFKLIFEHDKNINKPTEIFVPNYQYPTGFNVGVKGATIIKDAKNQRIFVKSPRKDVVKVEIYRK